MTFAIPKQLTALNSLITDTVIDVEMNDTDVDRMMTRILEMAVKRGRTAASRTDTKAYETYLDHLQASPHLSGFEGPRGRDVLDGWIRTSVLQVERKGLRRDEVQMGYLRPLTIAAYRSGLPKTASRNRRADSLAYRTMENTLIAEGFDNPSAHIETLFTSTFGQGVDLGKSPWSSPSYDEDTQVDIDTLLALRFVEGFTGSDRLSKERVRLDPPVPGAVEPLGRDLVDFLRLFGPTMPVAEAYAHLAVLLSLRLFQLPQITARHLRALLEGEEPSATNPSEIYCDFVRQRGSASDDLSRMCVVRDLEVMRTFFGDRLLMRSLGHAVQVLPVRPAMGDTAAEHLRALAAMRHDPAVKMALAMQIAQIRNETQDGDEAQAFIDEITNTTDLDAADQLTAILVEGLRKRGLENQVKWFWSTGGIVKTYGILAGTQRARSTWRYAPSDECLTVLLSMCFIEDGGKHTSPRLRMGELLARMERRFGILVARPPADLDSADARAGSSQNLAAFSRQLKLLGCYEGLSDDFSAQFVTRPREATH